MAKRITFYTPLRSKSYEGFVRELEQQLPVMLAKEAGENIVAQQSDKAILDKILNNYSLRTLSVEPTTLHMEKHDGAGTSYSVRYSGDTGLFEYLPVGEYLASLGFEAFAEADKLYLQYRNLGSMADQDTRAEKDVAYLAKWADGYTKLSNGYNETLARRSKEHLERVRATIAEHKREAETSRFK